MRKKGLAALLAGLMVLALSVPALAQQRPFPDVPASHWAAESVELLRAAGLVIGYPDGEFKGNRQLTRYEWAMIVARLVDRLDAMVASQVDAAYAEVEANAVARVNQAIADLVARLEAGEAAQRAFYGVEPAEVASIVGSTGRIPLSAAAESTFASLAANVIEAYLASYQPPEELKGDIEAMVADALSGLDSRVTRLEARTLVAQQDIRETRRLIEETANTLKGSVQALLDEFRADLDALGVRVADLEAWRAETDNRITALESRVEQLERETVNLKNRIDMTQATADEAINRAMALERTVGQATRKALTGAYQLEYLGADESGFLGQVQLVATEVAGTDASAQVGLGMVASGDAVRTLLSLGVTGPIGRVDTGAELTVFDAVTRFDLNAGLDMGILRFTTGARFVNDADPADQGLRGIVPGWARLAEGMTYHVGLGLPLEWRAFTITPVVDAVIADADSSTDGAETGIGLGAEVATAFLGGELKGRLVYPVSEQAALAAADKAASSVSVSVPVGALKLLGSVSTELGVADGDEAITIYALGIRGEF
ncbi:S-layer homology domain-containing protein [Limnochorda pilosa]|uniref:S-layer homology domain-containing protein n=1 Tax=Limnochorda pilosa TaxID=1555112 RepID=UPI0026F2A8B2|nr:S-layer homology domain-containing protein [Limnochorda pilosa]